jgi:hypothetical protein
VVANAPSLIHKARHAPGGSDALDSYYVPQPSTTPTDGQLLAWSSTLGAYTPVAPTGASELAYAANVTGTVTSAVASSGLGTAVDVAGAVISVPVSGGRPVVIEFGGNFVQTATGAGVAFLSLVETTSGSAGLFSDLMQMPQQTGTLAATALASHFNQFRIGVVTGTRTFKLQFQLYSPSGSSIGANLLNTATSPTYIRAVAA